MMSQSGIGRFFEFCRTQTEWSINRPFSCPNPVLRSNTIHATASDMSQAGPGKASDQPEESPADSLIPDSCNSLSYDKQPSAPSSFFSLQNPCMENIIYLEEINKKWNGDHGCCERSKKIFDTR